ncbi:natriuretic peptides A-like [Spea bombifrons]|uniref:natriuretic peptides A-like n=1 Tax=Spea bombifrons TaxID=233779 RepID=UPI00234B1AD5|nr:natriuretic peptides A-like [Spea bombifrons]
MGTSLIKRVTFVLLLFALTKAGENSAYGSMLSSDLSDLKDILSRLEERLPAEEPEVPSQDLFAQNYDSADSANSAPSWNGEASRSQPDLAYNKGSWALPEKLTPLKSKLRELLNAPRSFRRGSDCFGSRIDRIGAQSGMGCNSKRF